MKDLFAQMKQMEEKLGSNLVLREQLVSELTNWVSSKGFEKFAETYPNRATALRQMTRDHKVLTFGALAAFATLIGGAFFKDNENMQHRLAVFATMIRTNLLRDHSSGSNLDPLVRLSTAIVELEPDAATALLDWLESLNDDDQAIVSQYLDANSSETIAKWLAFSPDLRLRTARLGRRTTSASVDTPAKPAGKIESALKAYEEALWKKRQEGSS